MDFSLTEDQQSLRELARKMLEELATHERLKAVKATSERIDRELWRELAKANVLGVAIEERFGGNGGGLSELAIVLEEIGRAVAPVPVFPTLVLGALPIAAFGSEALRAQWLPRVATGGAILAAAIVDDRPSDVVRARRDGAGFVLDGARPLVQAAHVADAILVPARTDAGATLFVVDPRAQGVRLERVETTDEQLRPHLQLSGVRASAADVVGAVGQGDEILGWLTQRATLALCAMQVGVAERALEITARYTTERVQFDRPIGSFQAVHTRAGDAFVDVQAMRLTTLRALHLLEQGEDATESLVIAKYWAAEGGARVTYAAQHLHGGIGVDVDYPIHRYYLWARQIGLHLGSGAEQIATLGQRLAS
jgi:alkylation response protein AidB-like acyl-CoA dehydrogenase